MRWLESHTNLNLSLVGIIIDLFAFSFSKYAIKKNLKAKNMSFVIYSICCCVWNVINSKAMQYITFYHGKRGFDNINNCGKITVKNTQQAMAVISSSHF